VQHSKIPKLRHKNSPVNTEEWEQILSALLLGTDPENGRRLLLDGVEAIGKIGDSSMTITIHRRIEGITVDYLGPTSYFVAHLMVILATTRQYKST
jgi:hypothetical protein